LYSRETNFNKINKKTMSIINKVTDTALDATMAIATNEKLLEKVGELTTDMIQLKAEFQAEKENNAKFREKIIFLENEILMLKKENAMLRNKIALIEYENTVLKNEITVLQYENTIIKERMLMLEKENNAMLLT
jgi:hypothetical protein